MWAVFAIGLVCGVLLAVGFQNLVLKRSSSAAGMMDAPLELTSVCVEDGGSVEDGSEAEAQSSAATLGKDVAADGKDGKTDATRVEADATAEVARNGDNPAAVMAAVEQLLGQQAHQDPDSNPQLTGILKEILASNAALQQRLDHAEEALENQANEITGYVVEARIDPLTRCMNRRSFDHELARQMVAADQAGRSVGIILLDIDHFKSFNDTYGHLAGDAVLATVGRVLNDATREGETISRYGGEDICSPDAGNIGS